MRANSARLKSIELTCWSRRARKMLTSPALLSMVSSRSASTRAISTRSAGALSRPGKIGALLISRLDDRILARGGRSSDSVAQMPRRDAAGCEAQRGRRGMQPCGGTGGRPRRTARRYGRRATAALCARRIRQTRGSARSARCAPVGSVPWLTRSRMRRKFIEARLHDRVRMIVAGHGTAVDLDHQGLEFVAQIAHGADARHARTALERVQLPLQFRNPFLVLAIAVPGASARSCAASSSSVASSL